MKHVENTRSIYLFRQIGLISLGLVILLKTAVCQPAVFKSTEALPDEPLISGLHTLSIHVQDTITHDSVFHFLADKLKLPVYYLPVKFGDRKYAGVYAGNLVLEPCGPYSDYSYASDNFRAVFFGLTFEPFSSLELVSSSLNNRKIYHDLAGNDYIFFRDSVLCGDNITISFMDNHNKINDAGMKDSLRVRMVDEEDGLGIEYVRELCIGYKGSCDFKKWKELISPVVLTDNCIWEESNILDFHFVKSKIREVQSITFKVRSLKKAKRYLVKNNLFGSETESRIELNRSKAFGLSIYFIELD